VLAGTGDVRIGKDVFPIRPGDIIACPPGGPEAAHQIVNTGPEELGYLAARTKQSPEIGDYPETGRFGALAELAANADGIPRRLMFMGRQDQSLNYWEGE